MNVLITGSSGQLGTELMLHMQNSSQFNVTGLARNELDITDLTKVKEVIASVRPNIVINCAAYTQVETCEKNIDIAYEVNEAGARVLAEVCTLEQIKLIHISTDYVFDGNKEDGYSEDDKPKPINVYGKSKLAGENAIRKILEDHLIIRTSWVYGHYGSNFVKTILIKSKELKELKIVNDQIGCPTYTRDLVKHIILALLLDFKGTINLTNTNSCSWFEFAKEILKIATVNTNIQSISTSELKLLAPRPAYSILLPDRLIKLGLPTMPSWKQGLNNFFNDMRG